MKKTLKGEVTVFLSLLLGVILVFIYALVDSETWGAWKSYERGKAELAVSSVFAEYNTTLFDEYHIFALDATYESGTYYIDNVRDRLEFYGMENMEWEVDQLQLLSDGNGAAYKEQILAYMKAKYGVTDLENLWGDTSLWETQRIEGEDIYEEMDASEDSLSGYTDSLSSLWSLDVLNLVISDSSLLSTNSVSADSLSSNRTLEKGIACYEISSENTMVNKVLISEYILEHFSHVTDTIDEDELASEGLLYEVEYILEGEYTDEDNLRGVVNQILLLRIPVNYTCLLQSGTKMAEIKALALTMSTALGMPLLEEAVEQALLLSWAYAESILDLRVLLSGKKVPLIKTAEDWQLDLSGLFTLGTSQDSEVGQEDDGGLGYEDYLRILLYLTEEDALIEGAMDMMEMDMQLHLGCSYFQVDTCITQIEYLNRSEASSGYTYEFPVTFTYR
ncbi:MAG: DUF5702 domain-containing protein [Eubacteriales bacterium]